jgi:hypothetical protein
VCIVQFGGCCFVGGCLCARLPVFCIRLGLGEGGSCDMAVSVSSVSFCIQSYFLV